VQQRGLALGIGVGLGLGIRLRGGIRRAAVEPATEKACRWGEPTCRGVGVCFVATFAVLFGLASAIPLVPVTACVLWPRRRSRGRRVA
jgi:hypothetical protein